MFGQKVLFCLETGVWGAGVPRPGPGMPGCLRAPSSPASRSPAAGEPRPGSTAASDSASGLPAPRPRRGAPGWEKFRGTRAWPGGARPGPHLGLSWGLPAGGVGAGGQWTGKATARRVRGLTWRARPPARSPAAGLERDADCENRREGVGSFPLLIIAPACSFLHSHPIPAATQPRTRFQAGV